LKLLFKKPNKESDFCQVDSKSSKAIKIKSNEIKSIVGKSIGENPTD
jgi:hypothetical protein